MFYSVDTESREDAENLVEQLKEVMRAPKFKICRPVGRGFLDLQPLQANDAEAPKPQTLNLSLRGDSRPTTFPKMTCQRITCASSREAMRRYLSPCTSWIPKSPGEGLVK